MNLTTITDDCLTRLARGESAADCLARYPEAAEQLAPMLAAAEQLTAFSHTRLTEGQRLRAKVVLREELAAQQARRDNGRHVSGLVSWARLRVAPLAGILAVLLFVTVAVTSVAASQPGDFAYPVRVAVERAPALVQASPAGRAAAELAAADRRLRDLMQNETGHPFAVGALLRSDQAALERAAALSEAERDDVAARVAGHAQALERLANQVGDPQVAARLRDAASRALALTGKANSLVMGADLTPTATASVTRSATVQRPTRTVTTTASPKPPTATRALRTVAPGPTAEAGAPATPRPRPRLSVTPAALTRTPTAPVVSTPALPGGTLRPRPTLSVAPPTSTPRPRPTLVVAPPTVGVTVQPTEPIPTVAVPTVLPTRPVQTVQPTMPVVRATLTPPQMPEITRTPRRPDSDVPTPSDPRVAPATVLPEATPTPW